MTNVGPRQQAGKHTLGGNGLASCHIDGYRIKSWTYIAYLELGSLSLCVSLCVRDKRCLYVKPQCKNLSTAAYFVCVGQVPGSPSAYRRG